MKASLAIIFFILLSMNAWGKKPLTVVDVKELSSIDRKIMISIYSEFYLALEVSGALNPETKTSYIQKVLQQFEAYADKNDCVYGAWPSVRASHGYCDIPENTAAYKEFDSMISENGLTAESLVGFQECTPDERRCNPAIFGPVCAPFDSKYNRIRMTSNCHYESLRVFPSGFDYKDYSENFIDEKSSDQFEDWFSNQFNQLQSKAQTICSDDQAKQARTAVCNILAERLNTHFLPYVEESNGSSASNSSNDPVDATPEKLDEVEMEVNDLNIQIDRILKSEDCIDPAVAKVVDKRYNAIQLMDPKTGEFLGDAGSACLTQLKPLLERRKKLINNYESMLEALQPTNGCSAINPNQEQLDIEREATELNKAVAKQACVENPQKWTGKDCAGDFACAIGSSIFYGGPLNKIGAKIGGKLGFKPGCLNGQNNCVAKIVTAAADVIWSFLKSIPELAKMAINGVKNLGKTIYNWMPWVTESEQALSDANQMAMSTMADTEVGTLEKIGNFFTDMWDMLKSYITDDLMCNEPGWELERFKSNAHCDQPFVSWNCLSCAGAISGICNVVGAIGSEFVIGLLTGGSANIVKGGARAVSLGVKAAGRGLLKRQMATLAGKGLQKTLQVASKASKGLRLTAGVSRVALRKSKNFLTAQKGKFITAQKWVTRNTAKVKMPIKVKNQFVRNVAELTVEGSGKLLKRTGKIGKAVITSPITIPKKTIKILGRILDPFKLGEKGFARGYQAMDNLLPLSKYGRVTEFGYEVSKVTKELDKSTKASYAVDSTIELLKKTDAQMDEWIKAAQKGELSQVEYNQLTDVLENLYKTRTKFSKNQTALKALEKTEEEFAKRLKTLEDAMGDKGIKRYMKYSDQKYTSVSAKKLKNVKSGKELEFTRAKYIPKTSNDIFINIYPGNKKVLLVDKIDNQFLGYTADGKQVLISSENFSQTHNKLMTNKLKTNEIAKRFEDAEALAVKSSQSNINRRIQKSSRSKNLKASDYNQSVNQRPVTKEKLNQLKKNKKDLAKTMISIKKNPKVLKGKNIQIKLKKQLKLESERLNLQASKITSPKEAQSFVKEALKFQSQKNLLPTSSKRYITTTMNKAIGSIDSKELRNLVRNRTQAVSPGVQFGEQSQNLSFYGKNNKFSKSLGGTLSSKIDESGAYVKLVTKEQKVTLVKLVDETKNSFLGHNSKGEIVHIKKSALPSKARLNISKELNTTDPALKKEILKKMKTAKRMRVTPFKDPEFKFAKPLAKSEIRVGRNVEKLRKWQAGSVNINKNLVKNGAITLKSKAGLKIEIRNIHEQGDYWIGINKAGKRVTIPKFLMDAKTNKLMSRGRNFTKFKRNVKKNLSFVTKYYKKETGLVLNKAFRSKYKYVNFYLKHHRVQSSIDSKKYTTLEKIAENVYIGSFGDDSADIIYTDDSLSEEEQELQDQAFIEALNSDEDSDYNFDDMDNDDFEFE